MGSAAGALRTAAARIGISVDEYRAHVAAGRKWCTGCKRWHPTTAFRRDQSRSDGLAARCQEYRNQKARDSYTRRPRPAPGRRYVKPRNNDQKQARARVNYLITAGLLPRPNALPCTDCGHTWKPGQRRHEYDHHRGYATEHHEHVEAVCTTCHHRRETARRNRNGH